MVFLNTIEILAKTNNFLKKVSSWQTLGECKRSSERLKLTDLNIDCLEHVFQYLNLSELIAVADANQRLNIAANLIFMRKYSAKTVEFQGIHLSRNRRIKFEMDNFGNIYIGDLRTCLTYLRCFGHLIAHVTFRFASGRDNSAHELRVLDYINEYCSESLTEIGIKSGPIGWEEQFKKPFFKIGDVNLDRCQLGAKDAINRIFPRMQRLVLRRCLCSHDYSSSSSATNLKSVTYFSINGATLVNFPFSFGQLHSLNVGYSVQLTEEFFRFIDENSTIRCLILGTQALNAPHQLRIAEILPSLVSIHFQCALAADEAINFIDKFQNLQCFEFKLNNTNAFDYFRTRLSTEWQCRMHEDGFVSTDRQRLSC